MRGKKALATLIGGVLVVLVGLYWPKDAALDAFTVATVLGGLVAAFLTGHVVMDWKHLSVTRGRTGSNPIAEALSALEPILKALGKTPPEAHTEDDKENSDGKR